MRRARATRLPIAITGIGPICHEGFGVSELADATLPQRPVPGGSRSMSHFVPERFLGKRGFKFLPPAARYALAAAHLALEDAALAGSASYAPESKGVFVGTNFGVHQVNEEMDRTVLSEGAAALLAIETPNFSVNVPASYISSKYRFLAFNITLTNMLVAGLEGLMLGVRSIQDGRARLVLAGATEGPIPHSASAILGRTASYGAACMLALEALPAAMLRRARVYAQVGAHRLGFVPPDSAALGVSWAAHEHRLRQQLDALLGDMPAASLALADLDSPFVRRVNETVLRHCEGRSMTPSLMTPADACVSPLLWLSRAMAQHQDAMLLVATPQGHLAWIVLRAVRGAEHIEAAPSEYTTAPTAVA